MNNFRVRLAGAADNMSDSSVDMVAMNNRRELITATGLPDKTELVRLGQSFAVTAANAVAAVTALPTTAAHLSMNNTEPSNGKCYIIEGVFLVITTASGAAGSTAIAACINKGPQTAISTPDTVTIASLSGRAAASTNAKFKTGVTITNDGWFIVAGDMSGNSGTTAIGTGCYFPLPIPIILPPSGILSFAQLAVNATQAGKLGVVWHEALLPLVS